MTPPTPDEIERRLQAAAARILAGMTKTLRASPKDRFVITLEEKTGRFYVALETMNLCGVAISRLSFAGGDVQDACAQAVNTLNADESAP